MENDYKYQVGSFDPLFLFFLFSRTVGSSQSMLNGNRLFSSCNIPMGDYRGINVTEVDGSGDEKLGATHPEQTVIVQ